MAAAGQLIFVPAGPKSSIGKLEDVAAHAGGAKGDFAGIYGAARMRAGLKYENSD